MASRLKLLNCTTNSPQPRDFHSATFTKETVMIKTCTIVLSACLLVACVESRVKVAGISGTSDIGGCNHSRELPPLIIDAEEKSLLASVSAHPQNALDYYMLLPKRYFSFLPSDAQRRISYVDRKSLTNNYLLARRYFDCDQGGFDVTMRVFRRPEGDLIAIDSSEDHSLFLLRRADNLRGLNSVTLKKPTFWQYKHGWEKVDNDILPSMSLASVLDQYRNKYKADKAYPDQSKFIYLEYRLLPEGNLIPVIGRENFMDSAPTWAEYSFTGTRFKKNTPGSVTAP